MEQGDRASAGALRRCPRSSAPATIGALVLYGIPLSQAAAAVVVYRTFQLGIPAVLGAVAFVQLRRQLTRSATPAALCAPLAEPVA